MEFVEQIRDYRRKHIESLWEGTFEEYLELVLQTPRIARNAHSRVYDMISRAGWEDTPAGRSYNFFSRELFGIEDTLQILVEDYLKPAALGLDTKNRLLLLMGPVGTGKSTIVNLIKRGLEEYSRTPEGALYGIKGCPMHEEPLHLVPRELRGCLEKKGIRVEGSLCPRCRLQLEQEYGGDAFKVTVERVFLSEEDRVGIGTFTPSDPKSQEIAELTGSLDFSTIGEYGTESDPRAYRFDGELNKANRGIMEFQELLKCDEKFLYNLLSLSQEGNFKAGRFALISADELVIGHTNYSEFEEFIRESRHEALKSRLYVIPVPYNLRLSQEERIYKKLLDRSEVQGIHLAPFALRSAAIFSVLTRLEDPQKQGISREKKMYLYDGLLPEGTTEIEVKELKNDHPQEGMKGADPRFVLNCISSAMAAPREGCVSGEQILSALRKGLRRNLSISGGDREFWERMLMLAEKEHNSLLRKDVSKACLSCVPESPEKIFNEYMASISAFLKQEGENPGAGEQMDLRLMDTVEDHIHVTGSGKKLFREELLSRRARYESLGRRFDFTAHSGLREAVESEAISRILAGWGEAGSDEEYKSPELFRVVETLMSEFGYCRECVREALHAAVDI